MMLRARAMPASRNLRRATITYPRRLCPCRLAYPSRLGAAVRWAAAGLALAARSAPPLISPDTLQPHRWLVWRVRDHARHVRRLPAARGVSVPSATHLLTCRAFAILTEPATKRAKRSSCHWRESPCILGGWNGMRPLHSHHALGLWCLRGCFGEFWRGISLRLMTCEGDTLQSLTFVFQQSRRYFGLLDFIYGRPRREHDCKRLVPFKGGGARICQDGRSHTPIHAQGENRYERERADQNAEQCIVRLRRVKARHVQQRKMYKSILIQH